MSIGTGTGEILSVTVRYRTADGVERAFNVDPRQEDAVFLSMEAAEKFLLPYYRSTYGGSVADELQRRFASEQQLMGITIPRHKKICSILMLPREEEILPPKGS